MPAPRLEFRSVTKRFAKKRSEVPTVAVSDVSFSVADGEVVALIGPIVAQSRCVGADGARASSRPRLARCAARWM